MPHKVLRVEIDPFGARHVVEYVDTNTGLTITEEEWRDYHWLDATVHGDPPSRRKFIRGQRIVHIGVDWSFRT